MKMGRQINSANGHLGHRNSAPRTGSKSLAAIRGGVQELADPIEQPAVVVAADADRAVGAIGNLVPFGADARLSNISNTLLRIRLWQNIVNMALQMKAEHWEFVSFQVKKIWLILKNTERIISSKQAC